MWQVQYSLLSVYGCIFLLWWGPYWEGKAFSATSFWAAPQLSLCRCSSQVQIFCTLCLSVCVTDRYKCPHCDAFLWTGQAISRRSWTRVLVCFHYTPLSLETNTIWMKMLALSICRFEFIFFFLLESGVEFSSMGYICLRRILSRTSIRNGSPNPHSGKDTEARSSK